MTRTYAETYDQWKSNPLDFWEEASSAITWYKPPERTLDDDNTPFYKWFRGGQINVCYNAVDRHVEEGFGEQVALIYDSPLTDKKLSYTFKELLEKVAKFAGGLQSLGIETGDRVVIYMPMIPETVFAMLACARIGAIHSVVFGGFADTELSKRIDDAKPKLVISASYGIEPKNLVHYKPLLDKAIELSSHKVEHCIIFKRHNLDISWNKGRDIDGNKLLENSNAVPCVPLDSNHPLYILYTSGTTGIPKGVVRDSAGYLVALNWSMENIYNASRGHVFWAASDLGWVVGHSYIVYGPLVCGCTTVLYEGKPIGTPDAGAFWRIIEEHKVGTLFTAPTALRAIKATDFEGSFIQKYDVSSLRALFLAGERADPDTIKWAESKLVVQVIDHWWQTETGWPAAANFVGLKTMPIKYGSVGLPVPGFDICILDDQGNKLPANQTGDVAVKLPLPPGCLTTLWNKDEHYKISYLADHEGYYATGDAGIIDDDGYIYITSRTDDIINVAGHRLSTGGIEDAVSNCEYVAECAVVGAQDDLKGMVPVAFVVIYPNLKIDLATISQKIISSVRQQIGPVAALKTVIAVERLPKTRSGKILRGVMRNIADHEHYDMPATIDDPSILDEIDDAVVAFGYGRGRTSNIHRKTL